MGFPESAKHMELGPDFEKDQTEITQHNCFPLGPIRRRDIFFFFEQVRLAPRVNVVFGICGHNQLRPRPHIESTLGVSGLMRP